MNTMNCNQKRKSTEDEESESEGSTRSGTASHPNSQIPKRRKGLVHPSKHPAIPVSTQNTTGKTQVQSSVTSMALPREAREVIDLSGEGAGVLEGASSTPGKPRRFPVPVNDFPRYEMADVSIKLCNGYGDKYIYQFSSATLSHKSSWFKVNLQNRVQEYDAGLANKMCEYTGIAHRYHLECDAKLKLWVLKKKSLTVPREIPDAKASNQSHTVMQPIGSARSTTTPSKSVPTAGRNTPDQIVTPRQKNAEIGSVARREGREIALDAREEVEENSMPIQTKEMNENVVHEQGETCVVNNDYNEHNEANNEDIAPEHQLPINGDITPIREPTLVQIYEAYNNLFLIYHDKSPDISSTNIEIALAQSELIINIARYYHSIPEIGNSMSTILMLHGQDLFRSIARDPPRWLLISLYLECGPIFKEAVIHIVGQHPMWPWNTIDRNRFKPTLINYIEGKAADLEMMRARINENLFMSTIRVNSKIAFLGRVGEEDIDTWCIVQIWRDWFCRNLNWARISRTEKKVIDRSLYQMMGKAGKAYLHIADVRKSLDKYQVQWDIKNFGEDLDIMKNYAKKQVIPLLENNSMLNAEEEGFQHFTCTKIEKDELPWVKRPGLLLEDLCYE